MKYFPRLKALITAVLFLLLFLGAAGQSGVDLYNAALKYYNNRQYPQAIDAFTVALKADPGMANAYHLRGFCYQFTGNLDAAVMDYQSALRLAPNNAGMYQGLGFTYFRKKAYDSAMACYNRSLSINQNMPYTYIYRAQLYQALDKPELALKDYDAAIAASTNSPAGYVNRGNYYYGRKMYATALKDYNQAVALDPNSDVNLNNRGNCYNLLNRTDSAFTDFNKSLGLKADNAPAYRGRGACYRKKNQFDLAMADYNAALKLDPRSMYTYNDRGLLEVNMGLYQQAVDDYRKAIAIDSGKKSSYAIINIIEPLTRLRQFSEAAGYYTDYQNNYSKGYIESPSWAFYKKYMEAVTQNLARSDFAGALPVIKNAEQLYNTKSGIDQGDDFQKRNYSSILALEGFVQQQLNNTEVARQVYDEAILLNKNQPDVLASIQKINEKKLLAVAQDNSNPVIKILEPGAKSRSISVEDDKVASMRQSIRGQAIDPSGIKSLKLNNSPLKVEENGYFDTTVVLKPGVNIFTLLATDNNANSVSETIQLTTGADKPGNAAVTTVDNKPPVDYNPVYHAILIAESDYADTKHIPSLTGPLTDMQKIFTVLTGNYYFQPENVDTLVNAKKITILETIVKRANEMGENDNLFIFYAGHGEMITHPDNSEEGFLLPQDAERGALSTYISSDDLVRTIRYSKAKHILFVADACFAGSLFRDLPAEAPATVAEAYKDKSRRLLASGNRTRVPDQSEFIEDLRLALQENREGYITAEQLIDRFKGDYSKSTHLQLQYNPIKNVDDLGGQFVFKRKK